jgi:hypothetical protein
MYRSNCRTKINTVNTVNASIEEQEDTIIFNHEPFVNTSKSQSKIHVTISVEDFINTTEGE